MPWIARLVTRSMSIAEYPPPNRRPVTRGLGALALAAASPPSAADPTPAPTATETPAPTATPTPVPTPPIPTSFPPTMNLFQTVSFRFQDPYYSACVSDAAMTMLNMVSLAGSRLRDLANRQLRFRSTPRPTVDSTIPMSMGPPSPKISGTAGTCR